MAGGNPSNLKSNKLKILRGLCDKYNIDHETNFELLTTKAIAVIIKTIRRDYRD